ncbi:NifB/NifX family molybdenum-iron cluster-binding protein [Lutibacter sp. A64]|uniref:NifB/NifX family molybdenum-iron cluster-binding protein n=1 Tax=Lutibacter sp. A64 TaxID=2918526 RepID=UPI001F054D7D|nr:NifB/NifX family molybdenum-iron cluster-binding protein [Lutibacter sp. A64]UMB52875.1 NifB/NifX family molybdenum-iron cluster-binding protein [Lutibacter sp. A64]
MKIIAIPVTENNQIEDHFGKCEFYEIYTISEENEIIATKILESNQGCGCKSNIAQVLAEHGVTTMLAGGIGQGAINVLNKFNIEVIRGCSGNTKEIVTNFLKGEILDNGITCSHTHEEDHQCSH